MLCHLSPNYKCFLCGLKSICTILCVQRGRAVEKEGGSGWELVLRVLFFQYFAYYKIPHHFPVQSLTSHFRYGLPPAL